MLLRIDLFAHAKICKLSVALHGQHHIFWFDVTVDITLKNLTGVTKEETRTQVLELGPRDGSLLWSGLV